MVKRSSGLADTSFVGRVLKLEIDGVWWMRGRDGAWKVWDYETGDWQVRAGGPPAEKVPAKFRLERPSHEHASRQPGPTYWRDAKLRIIAVTLAGLASIAFVTGEPELGLIAAALSPITLILSIRHLRNESIVVAGFVGVFVIAGYYWWFHGDSAFRWRVGIMVVLAAGSWLVRDLPALSPPRSAQLPPPPKIEEEPRAASVLEEIRRSYRWASAAAVFVTIALGSILNFSGASVIQGIAVAGMTAGVSYYVVSRWAHVVAIIGLVLGVGTTVAVWFLSMFMNFGSTEGPSRGELLGSILMFSAIFYSLVNLVVLVFTSAKRSGLGLWPWRPRSNGLTVSFYSTRSTPPSE